MFLSDLLKARANSQTIISSLVFLHKIYVVHRYTSGYVSKQEASLESLASADLGCLFLSQLLVLVLCGVLVFITATYSVFLFPHTEEVVEGKSAILIGMSQWNSNDLVEQIETIGKLEENQGTAQLALHIYLKLSN